MEFQDRFATEAACLDYLAASRWPEGFICPGYGGRRAWVLERRHLWECSACSLQTSVTAGTVLDEFVRGMESGAIRPKGRERYKPNTVRSYERALRGRIAKAPLARIKVAELQRLDLQRFADDLLTSGLSASTVSNLINPIQAFYRWEINRDELTHNPSERIDLPNNGQRRPRRIASPGEAAALLAALAPRSSRLGDRVLRRFAAR
jgi:hypothetical protein